MLWIRYSPKQAPSGDPVPKRKFKEPLLLNDHNGVVEIWGESQSIQQAAQASSV